LEKKICDDENVKVVSGGFGQPRSLRSYLLLVEHVSSSSDFKVEEGSKGIATVSEGKKYGRNRFNVSAGTGYHTATS